MRKIAIIGGGITGLSAAHRLNEVCPEHQVELFEAAPRLGGVLLTESIDPFLVEHSADMFTTMDPAAFELCKRLGIDDQLIGTDQRFQRAFIAQGETLVPVPKGLNLMTPSDLEAIRNTSLLSPAGRTRFLEEEFVAAKVDNQDESLQSFAVRRFGDEAYAKIIQPLVGGIYTADPLRLSLRATLPQYLKMEAEHGSVIAATKKRMETQAQPGSAANTSGARYNLFVAPAKGMSTLIQSLQQNIPNTSIKTDQPVKRLARLDSGWELESSSGTRRYDAVLLTCPGAQTAELLRSSDRGLADLLGKIHYASSAIVIHAFERKSIEHALDGFGFVVPLNEGREILAGSFASVKFAGRAPEETVLTRTFIGGGCQPELLRHSDAKLCEIARTELDRLLKIEGQPMFEKVVRWNHSMPQYHLGHMDLVEEIEDASAELNGLEIAGKSYRGVGIPACVRSGESAAQRICDFLSQ